MTKSLVTIGYHYGELPWGKICRAHYLSHNLKGDRDIIFYEVKESDTKSGDLCFTASSEINRVIREINAKLWIDVHCGFTDTKEEEKLIVAYYGFDDNINERISRKNFITAKWNSMNDAERKARDFGVPFAMLDSLLYSRFKDKLTFEEELKGVSKKSHHKLLEEMLCAINTIHDLH